MKITIKKEFDGNLFIGSCENVPGCYVQASSEDMISPKIKKALGIIKQNCDQQRQPFPTEQDQPLFDVRIRFDVLSTKKLVHFFNQQRYHIGFENSESVLLINSNFPFNRVHLPQEKALSPFIVKKIFGERNTVYLGKPPQMKINPRLSSSA